MNTIKQAVTGLCLTTILAASVPCLAASGEVPQASAPALAATPEATGTTVPHGAFKLDLSGLERVPEWSARSTGAPATPTPIKFQTQASANGSSGMSTAKKTWIIVGSVLGAALLVGAVSNHGGGGSGGGGGY